MNCRLPKSTNVNINVIFLISGDPPTQPTHERSTQEAVIGKPVVLLPNLSKSYHSVQYKSVQWTHNDKPVSTDKDNAYKGGKKSSPSLEISSVSEEDFGLWKCILESENSKQVFVVQLTKGSIHSTLYNLPPI
ncbi:uncharacterized protein LOC143078547 [Mytilus galloprovincialis]|uniref:uncharacterized protein LOC143078547 n=1 Tax=Mytilus galloprovincialis TaxID=29158 RepID=UPI003F7CA6AF